MHSDHQRRGFGANAISDILKIEFDNINTDMIVAIVHRHNNHAIKLVRKLKFEHIEPNDNIGWKSGGMLDLYIMTREKFTNLYKIEVP